MYLTYAEYKAMGGELDETAFTQLEFEARSYVNNITFNRLVKNPLQSIPEEIKMCMYALVQLFSIKNDTLKGIILDGKATGSIIKQDNDGVSTSYGSVSTRQSVLMSEQEMYNTVKNYLGTTRDGKGQLVLFRGMYPGE